MKNKLLLSIFFIYSSNIAFADAGLDAQNELLFKRIQEVHNPTPKQMEKIKSIFKNSGYIGQGNPKVTVHPVTTEQCQKMLDDKKIKYENEEHEKICGDKYMAPLFNKEKQKINDSTTCIDKFEFPNIPCEYPVVWVRAKEAAEICEAMDKRLCDAHEWEGACEGDLTDPEYDFTLVDKMKTNDAIKKMRYDQNNKYKNQKKWGYGTSYQKGICGANSNKDKDCNGGNWAKCGSNTYPVGNFPDCKSSLDVYDIHGNAAEHMNLPLTKAQMSSTNPLELGHTEMKGSWFIFDKFKAHQDWCRWRAPYWHGSKVMDKDSHHNYHLGFRCCKSVK